MHFVYKTDNLFQSISISSGNSSLTKKIHFLKLIWTPDFLCVQNAPFKATSSFFNPFLLHLLFFLHLLIILSYKTLNWKAFQMNFKRVKVGMISSFHPHSMCKKVERVTTKTGCTSCTKQTISLEVSGFHTETRLLQRGFIFLNLFELHSFSVLKMHPSNPHHQFSTLSDFICYFSCIYWLFWAIRPWNSKAFQMNS